MSTRTSAFGLRAHKHRRSSCKAIPNHVFASAAVACLVLGCAWILHANVFGADVYPQLSSANFDAVIRRPAIVVRMPPLLSFDDRFAEAALQSVEPAAPAQAPKLIEAPKLNSPDTVDRADSYDEPFGLSTATLTMGPLLEKWLNLHREVDDDRRVLRMCEENRASCQSHAALQLLAIVDSGRALEGRARTRYDQPRNQSDTKARERFSTLWCGGRLECAVGDTRHRCRGLRRLRHRKVRCPARGRGFP